MIKMLDATEVSKMLHIGINGVRAMCREDKTFPAFRMGKKWMVNEEALNEWVNQRHTKEEI